MTKEAPRAESAIGHSSTLSYEEALRDAIRQLHKASSSDIMKIEIVSQRVIVGGFADALDLEIKIEAKTSRKAAGGQND